MLLRKCELDVVEEEESDLNVKRVVLLSRPQTSALHRLGRATCHRPTMVTATCLYLSHTSTNYISLHLAVLRSSLTRKLSITGAPTRQTQSSSPSTTSTSSNTMADSPGGSSDLSSPPSEDYEHDQDDTTIELPSHRSIDIAHIDPDHLAPPPKRRKTAPTNPSLLGYDRAPSSQPDAAEDDAISLSSDGWSDAPGSPSHDEYAIREDAQTECQWRDCTWGPAENNDELVNHVQNLHCATNGPKKTKYVCEWGECQRKQSNHPSGYALKAHMRSHTKEKPYYCSLPGKKR